MCLTRKKKKKQSKEAKETLSPINLLHSSCLSPPALKQKSAVGIQITSSSPPPRRTSSFPPLLSSRKSTCALQTAGCCICGCATSRPAAPCLGKVREKRGRGGCKLGLSVDQRRLFITVFALILPLHEQTKEEGKRRCDTLYLLFLL